MGRLLCTLKNSRSGLLPPHLLCTPNILTAAASDARLALIILAKCLFRCFFPILMSAPLAVQEALLSALRTPSVSVLDRVTETAVRDLPSLSVIR